MSTSARLFKQTAIYGLATVVPRMLSFFLVMLYTDKLHKADDYGDLTILMSYMVFLNVLLSYGMETAFFRFYNVETDKPKVIHTSMVSLFWSSIGFLLIGLVFRKSIALYINTDVSYVTLLVWILVLDALVIIPFAKLRVLQHPVKYAVLKMGGVMVNLLLNLFFLLVLPVWAKNTHSLWHMLYLEDFQVGYILLANVIASLVTFLAFSTDYIHLDWHIDKELWKKMLTYGFPILIAGIAFAVNEHLDKIILGKLLPEDIAKSEVGAYAACYKLALFMTLFSTAFRLGIEPFFFSHAQHKNAGKTYAEITKYFVIFGSVILLGVIVFVDVLKVLMLRDKVYWSAMSVVPLILVANFFLGIYTNLSVWYKLINKTQIGAYISIIGAILTLLLNYWLIPLYSYYGSAIATVVAYGTMMLVSYKLGQKTYPIPYNKRAILFYLGSSTVLSLLIFYFLREKYYVTIPIFALYLYFVYYTEKDFFIKLRKRK